MIILITGASGFVGQHLCKVLNDQNYHIKAVLRKSSNTLLANEKIVKQFDKFTVWKDVLTKVDIVIHLAGRAHVMKEEANDSYQAYAEINVDATKHLAEQAALYGVKRFIFLSSVKVNGESTDNSAFKESDQPQPEDDYGKTKYEAEKILNQIAQETGMDVVIIRPPLVYGKDVKANFKSLIKLCRTRLPLPLGSVHNKRSLIYIENLIDFIIVCMTHPNAANQTFLISDNDDQSTVSLITKIRNYQNKRPCLIPFPKKILIFIFSMFGKKKLINRLLQNLQIDISKAQALLEWEPSYTFEKGIEKTLKSLTYEDN